MNQATANAFLKTLEEPPPNTIIMLITERLQMILPTLLSRTQPIFFRPLTRRVIEDILIDQFEIGETTAKTAAKISAGNLKTAIRIASESDSIIRNWAFDILDKADKQDDLGFGTLLDKYKEQQKKDQISDLLKYVRILAADITELVMNPESDITNVDRLEYLQNTANNSKLSEDKLYDFLLFLEDLNRKIQGNANLGLVMINLYIKLKNLLHGKA
jgi:DNA polymerase-3 subunit delta'